MEVSSLVSEAVLPEVHPVVDLVPVVFVVVPDHPVEVQVLVVEVHLVEVQVRLVVFEHP